MIKKIIIIFVWVISLVMVSAYTYDNPEKVELLKDYFKKYKKPELKVKSGNVEKQWANSFLVEFSKKISFTGKTSFIIHDENILNFDENSLKIFYQNGYIYENSKLSKINLPDSFTTVKNGGVKSIFIFKNKKFGLISSLKDNCFYASIISLESSKELFKTQCLQDKKIDFNGLGSSHIHTDDKILLSIGTPEQASSKIRKLAQDENSMFGKIIQIDKSDLDSVIYNESDKINAKIFSIGHRNPQGLTKINDSIFSVEHGPKGGDELNRILEEENYGWPKVSYGTQYIYDENGKAYEISHENNKFKEPLFALVPSVGISALNHCPKKLREYYQKNCLLALSLYGNSLRPGRSIIIFLLNNKMDQVNSIEKIHLIEDHPTKDDLRLRHFVTNSKNELYEDSDGNIYVSADSKGIYKLSFKHFRN